VLCKFLDLNNISAVDDLCETIGLRPVICMFICCVSVAAIFGGKLFGRSVLPASAAPVVSSNLSTDSAYNLSG